MNIKIILISALLSLLSACNSVQKTPAVNQHPVTAVKVLHNKVEKKQVVEKQKEQIIALEQIEKTTINFNNDTELGKLAQLEDYLRRSSVLINEAKVHQDKNARYQFAYSILIQDLSDISNSINSFINQDKKSQEPRPFSALVKRY